MGRRGWIALTTAVALAAAAAIALAATVTVKVPDGKGDRKIGPDLRSASVSYNGTTVKHTIVARTSIAGQNGLCLVISAPKQSHDLLICPDGEVLGSEPRGAHVKVTRPNSKTIAYSFKPGKLKIKGSSYKWRVNHQSPDEDHIPNKRCAVEELTTGATPNPPKTATCRKFR